MAYNYNQQYDFYITKNYSSMNSSNTIKINSSDISFKKISYLETVYRNSLDPTYSRGIVSQLSQVNAVTWEMETYIQPLLDTNITSAEEYLWESFLGAGPTSTPSGSEFDFADGNVAQLTDISLIVAPRDTENKVWVITGVIESAEILLDIKELVKIRWQGKGSVLQDFVEGAIPGGSNFTDRTTVLPNIPGKFTTVSLTKYTSGGDNVYTLPLIGGNLKFENSVSIYNTPKIGQTTTVAGYSLEQRIISGELECYLKGGTGNSESLVKDILTEWANGYEDGDIIITLNGYSNETVTITLPLVKFNHANQNLNDVVTTTFEFTAQETSGNYVTINYAL